VAAIEEEESGNENENNIDDEEETFDVEEINPQSSVNMEIPILHSPKI
jgi:hypothetical protein